MKFEPLSVTMDAREIEAVLTQATKNRSVQVKEAHLDERIISIMLFIRDLFGATVKLDIEVLEARGRIVKLRVANLHSIPMGDVLLGAASRPDSGLTVHPGGQLEVDLVRISKGTVLDADLEEIRITKDTITVRANRLELAATKPHGQA